MPRNWSSGRRFDKDPPNLKRFRVAVEHLTQKNQDETENMEGEHAGLSAGSLSKSRKQKRKEERSLKKARKNAFLQKKPMPMLPDEDEIRRQKEAKELQRKQKKRLKEKQRKKRRKEDCKEQSENLAKDDTRVEGLLEANKVEDKIIKQLEKQMKMNRRRGKSLPKGFADEGLDYILDAVDSDKLNALYDSDKDLSGDEGLGSDDESPVPKKRAKKERRDVEVSEMDNLSDNGGGGENEDDESGGDDSESDELSDENVDLSDDDDGVGDSDGSLVGQRDDGNEKITDRNMEHSDDDGEQAADVYSSDDMAQVPKERKSKKKSDFHEDIYGRLRDSEGNVITGNSKGAYVPPAKRIQLEPENDKKRAELDRLKKQLKGQINRLSESNMQSIASQVEQMYLRNSRAEMNGVLEVIFNDAYLSPILTPERLSMEAAMMIALLHNNVDPEIGAHIIQRLAVRLDKMVKDDCLGDTKEIDNILMFLTFLYNFKVFHCSLIFDVLRILKDVFSQKAIEMILLVLKNTGFSLRKDDAVLLKDTLVAIQGKASTLDTSQLEDKSRIDFMLKIILAIRNNNVRKIPNYDPSHLDHLKKVLRGLIKGGSTDAQLRMSLEDLVKAEEKGKWWIVGSAWTGREESTVGKEDSKPHHLSQENYSAEILELARKQRMNTDVRRTIFCIVMSAEDYIDAFEKLLRLGLKNQSEREIVHVIMHCCMQEANFNKYYGFLLAKFCDYDRRFRMTFQFSTWDKFKELDTLPEHNMENLSHLLTHLLIAKAISLSIFKVLEFSELNKTRVHFLRRVLLSILDQSSTVVTEVFTRIATFPKLHMLREGLRLFMRHFLLRKKSKLEISRTVKENVVIAEHALQFAETQMKF